MKVDFAPEQMFVDISNWTTRTIGVTAIPFTGHFDFAGMMLKSSNSGKGVFQTIGENGIVENVKCEFTDSRLAGVSAGKIQNIQSRNTYSASVRDTGGIISNNRGTVFNCTVWAEVSESVTLLSYSGYGGIAYANEGTIDSCIFYGANVDSTSFAFGGIAYRSGATATESGATVTFTKGIFKNCRVYMPQNKSFLVDGHFGGIVCANESGLYIENCTASIKITGVIKIHPTTNYLYTGGLVGYARAPIVIKGSSTNGSIIDASQVLSHVGGIVGSVMESNEAKKQVQFSDCDSTMNITAGVFVGGIVGRVNCDQYEIAFSVKKCVNRGVLSATGFVGGIVGQISTNSTPSYISNCTNYGDIIAAGRNSGGIVADYAGSGGVIFQCINYGNLSGLGFWKGGLIGAGSDNIKGNLSIEECISYASVINATDGSSIVGYLNTGDTLSKCKVQPISGMNVYNIEGVAQQITAGKIDYLTPLETPAEKPKPEITKTMIMEADNVIKYQLDFNTDLIPAGTKIFSYKISVDGGSYFTQLIHKEYVLCKIGTAEIASSIAIGKVAGQYSRLTFIYNAPTTADKCMVLIRLSNNREYYL